MLVGAFNQEKALVGAFSVITNLRMELFQALLITTPQYLAELTDLQLGLATQLTASTPPFQFSSVRPAAAFNLSIYRWPQYQREDTPLSIFISNHDLFTAALM